MTNDERVLQYLADANPVPDPRMLDLRSFESVDLKAWTRRRREVRLQEAPKPAPLWRRRGWIYAAATLALAVIVGATAWMLQSGGEDDPVATTTPAPTTTAAPTTTMAPTTTTTAATTTTAVPTTEPLYPQFPAVEGTIDPGTYQPNPTYEPAYALTLNEPARGLAITGATYIWIRPAPDWQRGSLAPILIGTWTEVWTYDAEGNGTTIAAVGTDPIALFSDNAFLTLGEPISLNVGGYEATQIPMEFIGGPGGEGGFPFARAGVYEDRAITGDHAVVTIIDVDGVQLWFIVWAPPEGIEEATAFGNEILATIEFP